MSNYSTIRLRDNNIIDFCTGNGIVPLILSRRTSKKVEGIEIQKKLYDLAIKTIDYNKLSDRISLYNCDVKDFVKKIDCLYDLVLCNPPYFKNNIKSDKNISVEKRIARHEMLINLDEICYCASKILKDNGTFSMVHRVDRFMDVISCFKNHSIEPKRIKFIFDNINSESNLFLIEGQKNANSGLKIDKPLVLRNLDGSFTEEYKLLQEEIII